MSFDDDRARFKQPRGMGAAWVRFKIHNYHAGQASIAASAGDMEGYARHRAIADAARDGTLSFSKGPPVSIAEWRRDPPASSEQP